MKKLIVLTILISFFVANQCFALNLSRVKTWGTEVLTAADLNAEFDNILDHSILNADIGASAAIVGSKLDLSVPGVIGGTTPANGTFTTLQVNTSLNPDAFDGAPIGTTALEWSDIFLADGAVINLGDDQDVKITHVADTGIQMELNDKIMFGDTAVFVFSDDDAHLDMSADTSIDFQIGGTEQFELVDGAIQPTTDNDVDLGKAGTEFKDLHIDGTANIDTLSLENDLAVTHGGTAISTDDKFVQGWVHFKGSSTVDDSYNVDSVTDNGTGLFTITWTTDFASVDYWISGSSFRSSGGLAVTIRAIATGTCQIATVLHDGNNTDGDPTTIIAGGNQ